MNETEGDEDNEGLSWVGVTTALIGAGFGYSIVNGYGALHGVGMAITYLVMSACLWLAVKAIMKVRKFVGV